jgi:hypothetical protein
MNAPGLIRHTAPCRIMRLPPSIPTGPFTWAQLEALGTKRHQLDRWIDERLVHRVLQGVFQRYDEPDTVHSRVSAVALVAHPLAVICDRTAAWLHGVDTYEFRELEILPPIETWMPSDRTRMRRSGCAGGRRELWAVDVMGLEGVRVTTPLRTAMDLGATLRRGDALAALDGFMRGHGITTDELQALLPRYRRRRGVVQLRQLVPLADPRAESPGESVTRLAIIDADLPAPEPQVWVYEDGVPVYRLDLGYRRSKVAVEYDGEYHDAPEQQRRDEERREWLRRQGWTVIVVRKGDFEQFAREAWIDRLRQALRIP